MVLESVTLTGFYLLGITVIAHILLVNLIVGIAIIVPVLEWLSYRRKDNDLKIISQRLFKYLAATELVAGVWATWLTVVLGGYWSTLLFIATSVLFIPFTIAIIGILISIPSMAAYYYLWGKVSNRSHLMIGALMIIGTLLVPIGFNFIFTFINDPVGLTSTNVFAALFNPLYPDFTLHRIFGGLVMAVMSFTGIYGIKYVRAKSEDDKRIYMKGMKYGIYMGIPILIVQTVSGIIYALTLMKYSPYVAASVFGPIINNGSTPYFHLLPLMAVFILFIALIWVTSLFIFRSSKRNSTNAAISFGLLISALAGIPIGEYLNDAARYPYIVITGNAGVPAADFINKWMNIPPGFAIAALLVAAFLTVLFSLLLYWVFVRYKK